MAVRATELTEAGAALGGPPIDSVRALRSRLRMPVTLTEVGLTDPMVDRLVQDALGDVVLANNPIQPGVEELTELVRSLL